MKLSFPKHHKMWDLRFPQQYCWGTKPFWDEILCWHLSSIVLNECWETLTLWEGIRCSTSDNVLHLFESEGGTCERQSHVLYIKIPVLCSIYSVFQPPQLSVATQPFAWRNWKTLQVTALKIICLRAEKQAWDLWTLNSTDHITTMLGFTQTEITAKPVYPAKSIHNWPCHQRM